MAEDRPRKRSRVTLPGYGTGRRPGNYNRKWPAVVLRPTEIRALLDAFGRSPSGVRNRAMVTLMYRAAFKTGEIIALERWHYEHGGLQIEVPGATPKDDRLRPIDLETREALDRWISTWDALQLKPTSPFFCVISDPNKGKVLNPSNVRTMIGNRGKAAGISRRVHPQGIRQSGIVHRAQSRQRVQDQVGPYLDTELFQGKHPDAYEQWGSAVDQHRRNPEVNADRVGHDCRNAMRFFIRSALGSRDVEPPLMDRTVDALRALIAKQAPSSKRVRSHFDALIGYWGTVSDLGQRQEHAGEREKEPLTPADGERLIFHTLVLMLEIDRLFLAEEQSPAPAKK